MMRRFLDHHKLEQKKKTRTKKMFVVNKGSGISTDEEVYSSPTKHVKVPKNKALPVK